MAYDLQNFYKSTLSLDWSTGTGTFYVTTKPTISTGWLVISPNNSTTREIIKYTSTGTDTNGDYIIVSVRGVGGTTEQTHTVGEPIRMNITAEYWDAMNDDIAAIVASGVSNANTTTMGGVEIATDAEVIAGTATGGTGASLVATPAQIKTNYEKITPVVRTYLNAGSPATWTKPTGLKYVIVEVQAGGGGGGSANAGGGGGANPGGGGGGGGYSRKLIAVASLGATETVTTGAGGTAGSGGDGGAGGSSSFGTLSTATGGAGGSQNGGAEAAGGVGSSGDINIGGSAGVSCENLTEGIPGSNGGNSFMGGGGSGGYTTHGSAGRVYGGGGGGGQTTSGGSASNGGAGGAGIVIVTEFY